MDKYDLSSEGKDFSGTLQVLEYQGKKTVHKKTSFNNVYVKGFPKEATFTD